MQKMLVASRVKYFTDEVIGVSEIDNVINSEDIDALNTIKRNR
jgi:hypothetical protein